MVRHIRLAATAFWGAALVVVVYKTKHAEAFLPMPTPALVKHTQAEGSRGWNVVGSSSARTASERSGENGDDGSAEDRSSGTMLATQEHTSTTSASTSTISEYSSSVINNGYTMPAGNPGRYNDMLETKGNMLRRLFGQRPIAPSQERMNVNNGNKKDDDDEDGWHEMSKTTDNRSPWGKFLRFPYRAFFPKPPQEPGTLILVRHGESLWNANKTFTGWADPDLSERGFREVEYAARLLLEGGYEIDVCFTSRLKRAIRSVWIIFQEMDQVHLPVFKSWRLNERMYGALTGLCKSDTAAQLGAELVQEWRGSLMSRPPALKPSDQFWPGRERKYADLSADQIPLTESLKDCMGRVTPVWEQKIMYELRHGRNVMVVGHANTLRGLVKTIDGISDHDIRDVAIPTGIPIVYKFDKNLKPIAPTGDSQTACQVHMNGLFLEKPGLLKEALTREEEWCAQVPGYNETIGDRNRSPMSSLEKSLYKLRAERELGEWAGQFIDPNAPLEDDGSDGNAGLPMQMIYEDKVWEDGMNELAAGGQFDPDGAVFQSAEIDDDDDDELEEPSKFKNLISTSSQPCITSFPTAAVVPGVGQVPVRQDAVIVIIRHGKTEHNKLGLFTGWEDAPLAKDGVDEAREAGRLLKAHGFEFDVVYTSWLSRAIETAWHVIDELDLLWLPMVKTWRLNERMYGKLTGLSKQMVRQRHGDEQFKAWRRGYKTPPPKVSSFSSDYPGNDPRYVKYLTDLRFSVRESVIRSIEKGRPSLHRKLPKSESLRDCMERTIPYFTERIVPEAINQNKRVLISSSENAIRGLLMHLCEIPEDKITELEIPNGLPIIFDLKSKCVKLLDDGSGVDPLAKHNFGKAAEYLFRPCQNEDGSPDEECDVRFFGGPYQLSADDQAAIAAIKKREPVTTASS